MLLTITDVSGATPLNTISVREGDVLHFAVAGKSFDIEVIELKNFLVRDDYGVFAVRDAGAVMGEDEKIQRLIEAVRQAKGITFIRNGESHDAIAAADHLRRKYQTAGRKEMTARQFIDELASKSSVSGDEYRIKLSDGQDISANQWFSARLAEIEQIGSQSRPR